MHSTVEKTFYIVRLMYSEKVCAEINLLVCECIIIVGHFVCSTLETSNYNWKFARMIEGL